MRAYSFVCLSAAFLMLALSGCKKETETVDGFDFQTERLTELLPLQVGKYITYRLDSTVFPNFGRTKEVHSYQEKHIVDAQVTDNLGRPSYRIFRFLRDIDGTEGWKSSGTYFITPTAKTVEVIDNNLRVVKLITPVRLDYSWKGNLYLGNEPYQSLYPDNFNNDDNIAQWDFTYTGVDESMVLNAQTINHVYTVSLVNESTNVPITAPASYAALSFAEDKYAKGIGLIYQELTLWEYQPNLSGPSPFTTGFGVRRSMIDHN